MNPTQILTKQAIASSFFLPETEPLILNSESRGRNNSGDSRGGSDSELHEKFTKTPASSISCASSNTHSHSIQGEQTQAKGRNIFMKYFHPEPVCINRGCDTSESEYAEICAQYARLMEQRARGRFMRSLKRPMFPLAPITEETLSEIEEFEGIEGTEGEGRNRK